MKSIVKKIKSKGRISHILPNRGMVRKRISLRSSDKIICIYIDQIIFAKSFGSYINIYLVNTNEPIGPFTKNSLIYLENRLKDFEFIKTHQSYLVNLNYVQYYDKISNELVMIEDKCIPVSRANKHIVISRLSNV